MGWLRIYDVFTGAGKILAFFAQACLGGNTRPGISHLTAIITPSSPYLHLLLPKTSKKIELGNTDCYKSPAAARARATMPSPQQITAATNIRTAFLQKKLRYAMLIARCQSGKTGAFQELIRLMLLHGDIQRVYILCGSNDTELYTQAKEDTLYAQGAGAPVQVIFRQDFSRMTMDITNALIIVDESHMDQGHGQQLQKFLDGYGISMDGNPKTLQEKNTFLLSVDATPYSELASLAHRETPFEKHVEQLETGEGYFGLSDYKYGGLMRPTFDISAHASEIERIFAQRRAKVSTPAWGLMRFTHGKNIAKQEEAVKAICARRGWRILLFTADVTQVDITRPKSGTSTLPCLEDAPSVNTIVIIRGRLRAGKVVPKEHIAFVWEGAKNSKTDAIVQGLPGRMCGYSFGAVKPVIFVPPSSLTTHDGKVVKASEIDRAIMEYPVVLPTKGTNLKNSRAANSSRSGRIQCAPLRLTWPVDQDDWHFTEKYEAKYSSGADRQDIQMQCHELLLDNLHLIRDSPHYSAEQKAEILESIVPADPTASHIKTNQPAVGVKDASTEQGKDYYAKMLKAHENGTSHQQNLADENPLNFIVTYKGYSAPGANHRHLYVIFYTNAGAPVGLQSVPLDSRIAKTTGKSIFSVHDSDVAAPLAAGGVAGIDESRVKTPALLEAALREYMTQWKESATLTYSRSIQSTKERFALDKDAFHWASKDNHDVARICAKLGAEFGVRMKMTYGRSAANYFNLKTISW